MAQRILRVLVADDSEDDRLLLAHYLRRLSGFELSGITLNGVETIAWLSGMPPYGNRKLYPFPDLLLLDNEMPGYSGMDVIRWLYDRPRHPVIVLWSDTPELINHAKAHELGAAVVCAKPTRRSDLGSILARAFQLPVAPPPSEAHIFGFRQTFSQ